MHFKLFIEYVELPSQTELEETKLRSFVRIQTV